MDFQRLSSPSEDHFSYSSQTTMQPDQSKSTKEVFNLERAEEDDEFEEFERDGSLRGEKVINRLETKWN